MQHVPRISKRVLILSTSAGSGHKAAARALEKVFCTSPDVEQVVNKDSLEFTNQTFRDLYSEFFLRMVKNAPTFLGWWYDESDEPWRTDDVRLLLDRLNTQPLVEFITDYNPDITVCTHYMPAGIVAHLIARRAIKTSLSIVTTDFDFHSMWLNRLFNRYFVALDETRAHLVALGLPEERIIVSGIPVDPVFAEPVDHEAVLRSYRLKADVPLIMLSAGTVGGGPIKQIVERLMRIQLPAQFVIVCGRNQELRRDLEALVVKQAERFRILGFTSDMANLMKISSLLIAKPGGLTSSEAMAVGLPMAIIAPIPGQEERNSDHLLEKGAAIKFNDITVITYKIERLLSDPERLPRMRDCARALGRPEAAQVIVDTLLNDHQRGPLRLGKADRERMIEVVKGTPEPASLGKPTVALYDDASGTLLGTISEAAFDFLNEHLEAESFHDDDYYINEATVDMLAGIGTPENLLDILRTAIAERGECDIRWARI
jgi:processive 1,2-diacylglycerol beta-glucosyltransferase